MATTRAIKLWIHSLLPMTREEIFKRLKLRNESVELHELWGKNFVQDALENELRYDFSLQEDEKTGELTKRPEEKKNLKQEQVQLAKKTILNLPLPRLYVDYRSCTMIPLTMRFHQIYSTLAKEFCSKLIEDAIEILAQEKILYISRAVNNESSVARIDKPAT